jgi:hypothetical protein
MRRAPQLGQEPQRLQLKALRRSSWQFSHRTRRNPCSSLPHEYCQEGRELITEYLGEQFTMKVASVGYKPPYDPENELPCS